MAHLELVLMLLSACVALRAVGERFAVPHPTLLVLGGALVAPGRLTRRQALVAAGRAAAGIMYGATAMLFAAAFVEAFWSPRGGIEPIIKYAVGGAAWAGVVAYFLFAGRDRGA